MNDQEFDQRLAKLVSAIHDGTAGDRPRDAEPSQLIERLRARHEQLQTTAAALQGSLDSLRVSVKYLIFDLEATRRENATLKRQLATALGHRDEPPAGLDGLATPDDRE